MVTTVIFQHILVFAIWYYNCLCCILLILMLCYFIIKVVLYYYFFEILFQYSYALFDKFSWLKNHDVSKQHTATWSSWLVTNWCHFLIIEISSCFVPLIIWSLNEHAFTKQTRTPDLWIWSKTRIIHTLMNNNWIKLPHLIMVCVKEQRSFIVFFTPSFISFASSKLQY